MNIRNFIQEKARRNRDKVYLYFGDLRISYEDFNKNIDSLAWGLVRAGIQKGDRVCLMLPNSPEFLYSWFALSKIGGIMVPVNFAFKKHELKYILNHSGAKAIIIDGTKAELVEDVREECTALRLVISHRRTAMNTILFEELKENAASGSPPVPIGDEDVAAIIYTSGTTGPPKGVVHVHRSYVLSGQAFLRRVPVGPNDRLLTSLPLFHVNAQFYSTMGSLAADASLILIEKFSSSRFWDQVRRYKATQFSLISVMVRMLLNRPQSSEDRNHAVEWVNTGGAPKDLIEEFEDRFGVKVIEGYGLTECPLVCQNPYDGVRKPGSIGLPTKYPDPNTTFAEMKIVDQEGNELREGEIGEIIVKSPIMMKGYFRDPKKTAETIRDGWVYTGDYGFKDEDGYFYFFERKKEIIRRRGENISPVEVETVINRHPKVLESAVIPVPSDLGEDEVKAIVVVREGEDISEEEVIEWCKKELAYFKVPSVVEFRDDIPKTETGKIARSVLRKENR
nr:ATP-dependent acyl-CoA ligase [Desulfobacterales bacterium]